jgi:hypothetical protein
VSLLVMRLLAQAGLCRYAVAVAKAAPVALWCWVRLAVLAAAAAVCRLAVVRPLAVRLAAYASPLALALVNLELLALLQAIATDLVVHCLFLRGLWGLVLELQ